MDVVELTDLGLYCAAGDFYIDPWKPVPLAVITHGHADHARVGAQTYICSRTGEPILPHRLGHDIKAIPLEYGESLQLGSAKISLHPAGHVLGSAQVRVEVEGHVWVISGDYKRSADASCEAFETVPCDTFISEATFALPVYRWPTSEATAREILKWWEGYPEGPSLLFAYAFGKTQRILAEMGKLTDKTVYLHGAAEELTQIYRRAGIAMVNTKPVADMPKDYNFHGDLVLAPPSGHRSVWMKRFKQPQTGFASGWMQVRGNRRRRGYERGFVMSDHADWDDLITTIKETGAKRILLTHGNSDALEKYLNESEEMKPYGLKAEPLDTHFEGEADS